MSNKTVTQCQSLTKTKQPTLGHIQLTYTKYTGVLHDVLYLLHDNPCTECQL